MLVARDTRQNGVARGAGGNQGAPEGTRGEPGRAVKRVAVVSYHSSPLAEPGAGDSGGMTIYVRRLADQMERLGVATDIFTRAAGDGRTVQHLGDKVRVVSMPAGPARPLPKEELHGHLADFVPAVRAFSTSQRTSYDVVHSHYWQSGLAGRELATVWGVPLVHSHHTLGRVKNHFLAPGDVPEPDARLAGEAEVIDAADVLVASTDGEWSDLACLYGASHDRLKTLHPGVDHATFKPGDRAGARSQLGLGDEPVLLYVGRIQRLKGLELAIRSLGVLRRLPEGRGARLLVVGGASGPGGEVELARLEELAESLGLAASVRFLGAQPHERLATFYRAADVLVVCSHSESFGLAALEAQACGTPVVGTAVGGLSYVVRDGCSGWLVAERDPEVFASRVGSITGDSARRARFGAAAVASAAAFSWESTARAFLTLYECLVTEGLPELCTC